MRRIALALILLFVPAIAARAAYFPISYAEAVALVNATPQLGIKAGAARSDAFDPKTHPFVEVRGMPKGNATGGYLSPEYGVDGALADGDSVLALPLDSGGSGGIFTQLVFVRAKGAPAYSYAGHIDSQGHLEITVAHGVIVARMPNYAVLPGYGCCPTSYTIATYDIANGTLHEVAEKSVPAPGPIGDPTPAPPPPP